MVDFKKTLYGKDHKVKCHKCGKEMLIPNMVRTGRGMEKRTNGTNGTNGINGNYDKESIR